jgi:hypothetical protein
MYVGDCMLGFGGGELLVQKGGGLRRWQRAAAHIAHRGSPMVGQGARFLAPRAQTWR